MPDNLIWQQRHAPGTERLQTMRKGWVRPRLGLDSLSVSHFGAVDAIVINVAAS